MPTVLSHPLVAVGAYPWLRRYGLDRSALIAGAVLTVVPDLDVIGFWLGVPYSHMLGHRGLSHSLPFAIGVAGLAAALMARSCPARRGILWGYFTICLASHGLLDAITNGGLGIAFFAPFSNERYFFDVNPIQVSALAPSRFVSERMVNVLASELIWVWLPFSVVAVSGLMVRRVHAAKTMKRVDSG